MPDTTPNVTPEPGTGPGPEDRRRPGDRTRAAAPPPAGTVAPGGAVPPGEVVLPDEPAADEPRGRTTAGSRAPVASGAAAAAATPAAPATAAPADGQGAHLLPDDECDRIASRMRHAVVGFVDGPRDAVEEADQVLEELAARLTDAVDRCRRTLRGSWQETAKGKGDGGKDRATATASAPTVDTEQLRLALRDYRALTERLLHL
ncbi:hypothetical protein [Streptomyces sp. NPDC051677]|uniref:hypothetical protein n=1 Tax=Streptomyces sp. NPDC051677 TaxID=3365669 RepID=UPI0037D00356